MRRYIFICIGGTLGAIARYLVKGINLHSSNAGIPVNTLLINITGSFILAMTLTMVFGRKGFDTDIRVGFTTGFLGAYTTFSTLCRETATLLKEGSYSTAASYVLISAVLGLTAAYLGFVLARRVIAAAGKDKDVQSYHQDKMEGGADSR